MPYINEALAMAESTNQLMDERVATAISTAAIRYTRKQQLRTRTYSTRAINMSALVSALNLEPASVPQATLKRAFSLERRKVTSTSGSTYAHLASRRSDADNFEDGGLSQAADAAEIVLSQPQSHGATDQLIDGPPQRVLTPIMDLRAMTCATSGNLRCLHG